MRIACAPAALSLPGPDAAFAQLANAEAGQKTLPTSRAPMWTVLRGARIG